VVLTVGVALLHFYRGDQLQAGCHIAGPAIIVQPDTTVFIGLGDELKMDGYRNLIIEVKTG
jgi:N-methylhydantoinase A/oxoprolinase/acetone carboxylase beta subunit